MSFVDLNKFPIDKVQSSFLGNPLCFLILFCLKRISDFFSRPESFFQSQTDPLLDNSKNQNQKNQKKNINNDFESSNQLSCITEKNNNNNNIENGSLCREDAEMVMKRLGISCSLEGEKLLQESFFVSDDLAKLFEEKEPSLDEVKEAFDVFDENRDGFIDAMELHRVLCVLGFKEGSELHSCTNMIKSFDENGDGKIDFSEFVKFMENSFC